MGLIKLSTLSYTRANIRNGDVLIVGNPVGPDESSDLPGLSLVPSLSGSSVGDEHTITDLI